MQTPLLLEINTNGAKLSDIIEKIVKPKLGMSAPTIMHGTDILYETGDDLDEDLLASYAAKADKVTFSAFNNYLTRPLLNSFIFLPCYSLTLSNQFLGAF